MDILLVGAGTVGQVYGYHLQKGGARVAFLVKEKYVEETRAGHTLYPHNRGGFSAPIRFTPDAVHTAATLKDTRWDAIILCVSSTGLRGSLMDDLAPCVGNATVVCLQPATSDHAVVTAKVPEAQVVDGGISLIAYHAPLPTETVPQPGTAFWFTPMTPSMLSGSTERVRALLPFFRKGGMPMKQTRNAALELAAPGALLMVMVRLLEQHGWSFAALKQGNGLSTVKDALVEATHVLDKKLHIKTPLALSLVGPWTMRMVLTLAPKIAPFDIETYFKVHFSKVGDQTQLMLRGYVEDGASVNLPTPTLQALLAPA